MHAIRNTPLGESLAAPLVLLFPLHRGQKPAQATEIHGPRCLFAAPKQRTPMRTHPNSFNVHTRSPLFYAPAAASLTVPLSDVSFFSASFFLAAAICHAGMAARPLLNLPYGLDAV